MHDSQLETEEARQDKIWDRTSLDAKYEEAKNVKDKTNTEILTGRLSACHSGSNPMRMYGVKESADPLLNTSSDNQMKTNRSLPGNPFLDGFRKGLATVFNMNKGKDGNS